MQQSILAALKAEFPGLSIRENVPWREVTSLKAGGVIPVLAEPGDDIVLAPLLYFCHSRHIPVLVLGNGSNTVGADALPETLVLRLNHGNFVRICFARDRIVAGAGVRWKDFVRTCAEHGFGGLAPLAGIPGQVGGLLMMNAGPILDKIIYSKGAAVHGQPKKTLSDIARTINGTWFVDNGTLHIFSYSDSADKLPNNLKQAVELTPQTGLIGNPQQVNYGITVRCLLNPKIMPYGLIYIPIRYITKQMVQIGTFSQGISTPYTLDPNGIYRVCSVTFTGDTRGNEWYSDIVAVDQGGEMMSMLTNPNYTAN